MMTLKLRGAAVLLMLGTAAPVLAQVAVPAAPAAPAAGVHAGPDGHGMRGGMRGMRGHKRFASMSEAGRIVMREAMQAGGERAADREAIKAARDRMLTLLEADRLDTGALKRAMDEERKVASAGRERHQASMLAGFTKLSVADRKAFVADSRAMKTRMEGRMKDWRGKGGPGDRRGPPAPAPAV
ncbi:hypothetical protein GCM10011529_18010 [Polymorphobacter glacialis]|uniref:Periplasmic heavy metal sensor n=1 Tax=Sandarakinorhabdus glacialis TaxID=1614636 RepID=A0A916ZSM3_9SPHN|nr:periplasmic heavy metal sensor [Polymorphobacter glacialis]GGE12071.1 hypothetical protein GCM10011529_18010 [Polymorphobacter glacialis]